MLVESAAAGTGRHVLDLTEQLGLRGHDVVLVYSPRRCDAGFRTRIAAFTQSRVVALPLSQRPSLGDLIAYVRLRRLIRARGPFDVLHAHSSKAGALLRMLPRRLGARVYTPHALRVMDPTLPRLQRAFYGGVERMLGRFRTEAVVAVSPGEARACLAAGIPANKVHTVVNGVSAMGAPSRTASDIRMFLNIDDDTIVIGFVGRLSHQKAPERLLRSFARVAMTDRRPILVMVGGGELLDATMRMTEELGIADRCRIVGEQPSEDYYPVIDLLVLPSRYEAMPYVLLEAATAGIPVIATEVGGTDVVVDHGRNGYLIPNSDDPDFLVRTLGLALEEGTYAALHAEAQRRRGNFGIDDMVDGVVRVYEEVCR